MIISWDEYFMGIALFSKYRSKDPHTQVGACIVNEAKHIVGVGYNGMPNGCSDEEFPWGSTGEFGEKKYAYRTSTRHPTARAPRSACSPPPASTTAGLRRTLRFCP